LSQEIIEAGMINTFKSRLENQQDLGLKRWCFSTQQPKFKFNTTDCYRNVRPSRLYVYTTLV